MGHRRRRIIHFDGQLDAHLLTFSCFHRYPLLQAERTCDWFVQAIDKARAKHCFDLWAWVAMPDHAHVLLWPWIPGYSTANILQSIKTSVGRKAINYLRKHAPRFLPKLALISGGKVEYHFWQDGPGHDRNLNEPAAIHEEISYNHENPVKAGLVMQTTDWKYSSARAWAGDPNPILQIDFASVPRINAR